MFRLRDCRLRGLVFLFGLARENLGDQNRVSMIVGGTDLALGAGSRFPVHGGHIVMVPLGLLSVKTR